MSPASRTAAAAPPVPSSTGRRLLLLDGHSLAYRAFFALPAENFRTGTGQTTNAVYGFTAMLINLLRDEQPTHLAVCFDVSRQTFRSERYTEYKANRTTTPDDFRGQVDLIKEVLRALAIPEFGVAGFEADDLIATLATQAEVDGFQVLITTGDRDAFQLVSDNVTVLYPTRGVSELGRIDPDAVMARYGLTPAQYPDFAALRGDPSDNLPSIPGVGEKTAAKWVREFGSLAELTDRVDEVKGKAGDALRAHLAGVVLNRQLTELVRDVPLDARPEDLAVRPWDRDAVHRLFDELEFRVLRERLFATLQSAEPEAEGGIEVQGGTIAPGGLRAWLDAHARDGRRVGLAFHGVVGTAAVRTSSVSCRLSTTLARCSRSASPALPFTSSTRSTSASREPYSRTHLAAVFSPTLGMLGRLSLGSPRSAAKSGYCAGVSPYLASTSPGVKRVMSETPLRG